MELVGLYSPYIFNKYYLEKESKLGLLRVLPKDTAKAMIQSLTSEILTYIFTTWAHRTFPETCRATNHFKQIDS